jgi:hypothetical protein
LQPLSSKKDRLIFGQTAGKSASWAVGKLLEPISNVLFWIRLYFKHACDASVQREF